MNIKDISLKTSYRTPDDISNSFYVPLLSYAKVYKRAVGFFSSSILIEISKGLTRLAKNQGKIMLITSPRLQEDDIAAIDKGYDDKNKIIERALMRDFTEPTNCEEAERLNLLSHLIAQGILDIKIAFKKPFGLYHEKLGIIEDFDGNYVAFSGSLNESLQALSLNFESIDVFTSWNDANRVSEKLKNFDNMWANREAELEVIEFPKVLKEKLESYKRENYSLNLDEELTKEMPINDNSKKKSQDLNSPFCPINLHDYQKEAIIEWQNNDYKGIFDMATGTGKTYTGLGALVELYNHCNKKLAVVICCPYQHLVEQWVEDIEFFNIKPIIGYSKSPQKDWYIKLENAIRYQKIGAHGSEFFCFICTNSTFALPKVQKQILKIKNDALVMIDEAHNFGATNLNTKLPTHFKYKLALSATLDRHNDEEGTKKLYNYFGKKCIEYPLARAIKEEKLTPYKYYPIPISLSQNELDIYNNLSREISKQMIVDKVSGKKKLSKYGEILALKRARVVAAAKEKLNKLEELMLQYSNEKHILVYCGATSLIDENADTSEIDESDIRQIEAVTDILGNKLGMTVSQFTSKEDIIERGILKKEFDDGSNLQVLIAIKCLDEGVNIPKIRTAFILASTTNPKEYIQRRGRVLRKAINKEYAEIYDFITLPRTLDEISSTTVEVLSGDVGLIKKELDRMEEFAKLALNPMDSYPMIWSLKESYQLNERYSEEDDLYII